MLELNYEALLPSSGKFWYNISRKNFNKKPHFKNHFTQ